MVPLGNEKLIITSRAGIHLLCLSQDRTASPCVEAQDAEETARGPGLRAGDRWRRGDRAARTWVEPGGGGNLGASTHGGECAQRHLLSHSAAPALACEPCRPHCIPPLGLCTSWVLST